MEKEKRKTRPRNYKMIVVILIALGMIFLCGRLSYSYYIYPGQSLSYFSRFETTEEAVAFLHDNFDLFVTTSNDILTFMDAHGIETNDCYNTKPYRGDFADNIVDETVTKIINCRIPTWQRFPGTRFYRIRFYINRDDLLVYIGATLYCICL